jgi:YesN/AraC family two-component response regulator
MLKIFLIDDQPMVRAGLRLRLGLEADLLVVGEAGDGATALAQAQDLQPDIALVDVEMPGMDGVALTTALRQLVPRCAVIILRYMFSVFGRREKRSISMAGKPKQERFS